MMKHALVSIAVLLGCCLLCSAAPGDFNIVLEFENSDSMGGRPVSSPILSGGMLYGMTPYGGISNRGVIYRVDLTDTNHTVLHQFTGPEGKTPLGSLLLDGTNLYGMTSLGGANNAGVAFRVGTNGSGYTVLHDFDVTDESDGGLPWGTPVLSGGKLYGMTYDGGVSNGGVVFAMDTDGSNYTNLHRFVGGEGDGLHPKADVLVDGTRMYGMTSGGGANNAGAVFAMDVDGTDYTNLYEFTGGAGDGQNPSGSLIKDGAYLYGSAMGGSDHAGVAFCLPAAGGTMNAMWFFSGSVTQGASPYSSLLKHDTKIYGVTRYGGSNSVGVLYALGAEQSNQFMWGEQAEPIGDLLADDDTVYGTTLRGGVYNKGTIFSFELDTNDGPAAWCAMTWIENGQLADILAGDMPTDRLWIQHNTAGGFPTYAYVGYGETSGTDDGTWTWLSLDEYGVVNGGSDYEFTGTFSRASAGDYLVAAKFIKGRHVYYTTGLGQWGDWSTGLYATNTWTVTPLTAPSNSYARYMTTNRIDVHFDPDGVHWVTVFRKPGDDPEFLRPSDGTEYFVGDDYAGQGECVYRGDATLLSDTGLVEDAVYSYKLYTENWAYYSTGSWASASTDPDRDDDGDAMPNEYEDTYGFNPGIQDDGFDDEDDDGMVNWTEYIAGTDPTNDQSLLEITDQQSPAPATYVFTWDSVDGKSYSVWRSTNLVTGFSECIASNVAAVAPANTYTDVIDTVSRYYYRVEVER